MQVLSRRSSSNAKNTYKIKSIRSPVDRPKHSGNRGYGHPHRGTDLRPCAAPTKKELYTVLRSPVIDKKSREQFQLATHKRLIDLVNPTSKTVEALRKLNLPAGVDVEIKQ